MPLIFKFFPGLVILSFILMCCVITEGKLLVEVDEHENSVHRRTKRQALTGLTTAQQTEAVDAHNHFRSLEGASNMVFMKFNQYLADMAQDWADVCIFDHGQPARNASTMPYNPVGQNLLITSGSNLNMTWAVEQWYIEKNYYTFDTRACQSGKLCGHYTQVVWDRSLEIGCGVLRCENVTELHTTKVYYDMTNLVCNYGPAGNLAGTHPYKKGPACTQCGTGDMTCYQNLCKPDCVGAGCSCNAVCKNCANVTASCSCQCANGWRGIDCSVACVDTRSECGGGWPSYMCNDPTYGKGVTDYCPKLCGTCNGATPSDPVCASESSESTTSTSTTTTNSNNNSNNNRGVTVDQVTSGNFAQSKATTICGESSFIIHTLMVIMWVICTKFISSLD